MNRLSVNILTANLRSVSLMQDRFVRKANMISILLRHSQMVEAKSMRSSINQWWNSPHPNHIIPTQPPVSIGAIKLQWAFCVRQTLESHHPLHDFPDGKSCKKKKKSRFFEIFLNFWEFSRFFRIFQILLDSLDLSKFFRFFQIF
jgi:hypothetical protein